ncbi:MAG TPA: single-stranded-DNA-specific exonuclease RecJ [Phycisphaerales bacterium]|nr:single-stranded-DNA-specific exonuclease RecJ [Phycisphaerales bacterium]|tara:strand:- start:14489 stop:16225 length:1737 start_codon:yes stop_codon:yes gene_type:complete
MFEAGMLKRWRFRPNGQQTDLAALGLSPLVDKLLGNRGVIESQQARDFLDPKMTQLHDPQLLPNISKAASRMSKAVRDNQPIVIYGDYDVDGITASSILWHTLRLAGAHVRTYVPHRIEEGYGINAEAITAMCEADPLIISVDCGITAVEPAAIAKAKGVDLIITDHHEMDAENLPDAYALVHPRLPGSEYPFGELCGAGVAFKLAWQFARVHNGSDRLPQAYRQLMIQQMSLAALGTVADIVPLVDENRVLTTFGLGQIKHTDFIGLNALIDAARLRDEKIDAYHVGFVLGPRLNACGRMGHAKDAVHLLTEATEDEAVDIAEFLTEENDKRRATEKKIVEKAAAQVIDRGYDRADCRAIVVADNDWHPGVVGIVASRIVEQFSRPAIVLNIEGDEAHGSARSVEGVSIHEALQHCEDLLVSFGGHAMAAGLRVKVDKLDAFREKLVAFVNDKLSADDLCSIVDIDTECELEDLTLPQVKQIERMAPFGPHNPKPVLCVRNVQLDRAPMLMGQTGKHMRLTIRQGSQYQNAVAFGMADLAPQLYPGMKLDIAFEPKTNHWQGRTSVDMMVKDLKIRE